MQLALVRARARTSLKSISSLVSSIESGASEGQGLASLGQWLVLRQVVHINPYLVSHWTQHYSYCKGSRDLMLRSEHPMTTALYPALLSSSPENRNNHEACRLVYSTAAYTYSTLSVLY